MATSMNPKLTRRNGQDPRDMTTWSLPHIVTWLLSCEAHVQAHRVIRKFRAGPDGECICNTCVSRRSTYGK